jgi:hypothetical protein
MAFNRYNIPVNAVVRTPRQTWSGKNKKLADDGVPETVSEKVSSHGGLARKHFIIGVLLRVGVPETVSERVKPTRLPESVL